MIGPIKIDNSESEFLIETPEKQTNTIVLFLPGMSGDAFSERYQPIADACLKAGFAIARINAWKNAKDVEQKKLTDIYRDIDEVINYVHRQGYRTIYGIGKSFGGTILLIYPQDSISKKVLWSPAIGIADSGTNLNVYESTRLSSLHSILDLHVDQAYLRNRAAPTLIVHGTIDNNIPFSNSEKLVSFLPNAQLYPIKNADHSYKNKEHETMAIKNSINHLLE